MEDAGNEEVALDLPSLIRVYKDGRIERCGMDFVPPSLDSATGVTSKDVVIDAVTGVRAPLYLPDLTGMGAPDKKRLPVLVYYHGGAFCADSAFSRYYHPYLNALVAQARVVGVSVEYRLAPEHPIPAAYEDSWRALQWVVSSGSDEWLARHGDMSRVFLAGDSAGGNITHHMAMKAGAEELGVRLAGVVLVHPGFWGPHRIGAEAVEPESLSVAMTDAVWPLVCPTAVVGEDDPRFNPLAEGAPSLAGLGCDRVLVAVPQKDLLRDRGWAYYHGLKASGYEGKVEDVFETEGEDHCFHIVHSGCHKAAELMHILVEFFNP